ncbi:transporter substrate-binding domain-containing protein [Agrobacterium sp. T29]|uniref:transporter substrate-binding domain-containing protein n=1 Tax=Agrobacterium sp. T29 TaxID=2580515 RepID=UPI00115C7EAC|nr:transporter substrate-binding domain-containing protein [Agrobacterium sp. T29]
MNSFKLSFGLLIFFAIASGVHAQDIKTIKIATEGAFPPWNAVDPSGNVIGFDVDVGRALCERAELKCQFVTQAWDGIIPALTIGKYDAIMAGMSITEKRRDVIEFSAPYALTSNYFVFAKSNGLPKMDVTAAVDLSSEQPKGLSLIEVLKTNLKGKTIGVQGSTNAEVFLRQYFGEQVQVRIYDKQDSLNLDLVAGRIDGGLADYSVWKAFLESNEGAKATLYGPRISGGVFGPGVGIGLRKQEKELADRFNLAIETMKTDGTLRGLSLKWFGADIVSK